MHTHNLSRLVVRSNGYLLLACAQRKNGEQFTFLPGGHIEYNESLNQAGIRELQEEIGISPDRISGLSLLGIFEHSWDNKGVPYHEISFLSTCHIAGISSDLPPSSLEEHLTFKWVHPNALEQANFLPAELRQILPSWLEKADEVPSRFASTML